MVKMNRGGGVSVSGHSSVKRVQQLRAMHTQTHLHGSFCHLCLTRTCGTACAATAVPSS